MSKKAKTKAKTKAKKKALIASVNSPGSMMTPLKGWKMREDPETEFVEFWIGWHNCGRGRVMLRSVADIEALVGTCSKCGEMFGLDPDPLMMMVALDIFAAFTEDNEF